MSKIDRTAPVFSGLWVEPVEITPNNFCGEGNTIPAVCQSVFLLANTNNADDWTCLPALADVPDGHIITLVAGAAASEVRSASGTTDKINNQDCGTDVAASGVLTSDQTKPSDGDTVTVGTIVYRFKTTPIADLDVKISALSSGAGAAASMLSLLAAINGVGVVGTDVYSKTAANVDMTAVLTSTYVITVTARKAGVIGNALAKAETSTHLDWDGTGSTMGEGGLAGVDALEYVLALNQMVKFTKINNTVGWMGLGWTPIGAIIAAITPD